VVQPAVGAQGVVDRAGPVAERGEDDGGVALGEPVEVLRARGQDRVDALRAADAPALARRKVADDAVDDGGGSEGGVRVGWGLVGPVERGAVVL
jgi:hypothetical protein